MDEKPYFVRSLPETWMVDEVTDLSIEQSVELRQVLADMERSRGAALGANYVVYR